MMKFASLTPPALLLLAASAPASAGPNDRVIHSGESVTYNTLNGDLVLDSLEIEAGAILHVVGPARFRLLASRSIRIDGILDLSGQDHPGVVTLNTPSVPVFGALGGPQGGRGGTASSLVTTSTPAGLPGANGQGGWPGGGGGGESGFNANTSSNGAFRRAAGGGGGLFGPPELVVPGNPEDPANLGRVALAGVDGNLLATGAVSGLPLPKGGTIGSAVFVDGFTDNNFFGRKALQGGGILLGELAAPQAGQGGGGGGDAVITSIFPPPTFIFANQDQGCGGGGGGGLGILISRRITVGPQGTILVNGGDGGGGENTLFLNRIGGGSGAGSGGMLALQAETIDLSLASLEALSALGGAGGPGANNQSRASGGGGHGGLGLIQLHVPNGDPAHVLLPLGRNLTDLSAPDAHILMLESSL